MVQGNPGRDHSPGTPVNHCHNCVPLVALFMSQNKKVQLVQVTSVDGEGAESAAQGAESL